MDREKEIKELEKRFINMKIAHIEYSIERLKQGEIHSYQFIREVEEQIQEMHDIGRD